MSPSDRKKVLGQTNIEVVSVFYTPYFSFLMLSLSFFSTLMLSLYFYAKKYTSYFYIHGTKGEDEKQTITHHQIRFYTYVDILRFICISGMVIFL